MTDLLTHPSSAVFIFDVPPVESITLDEYFASID